MTTAAVAPAAPAAPVAPVDAPAAPNVDAKAPVTPKVETPAARAERIRLKYKANGKESEVEKTHDELARDLQVLEGLRSERPTFLKERDAFNADRDTLLKDPIAYMKQHKLDLRALAQQQQAEEAELAAMTPENRRIRELEADNKALQEARDAKTESDRVEGERAAHQKLVQNTFQSLEAAIKVSGMPRSGPWLKTLAEVQELAIHAGEPDLSPEQLAAAGERLTISRLGEVLKHAAANEDWRSRNAPHLAELAKLALPSLDGQPLLDFLGKEMVTKVARAALASMRNSPTPIVQEPQRTNAPPPAREKPRDEWDFMDRAT